MYVQRPILSSGVAAPQQDLHQLNSRSFVGTNSVKVNNYGMRTAAAPQVRAPILSHPPVVPQVAVGTPPYKIVPAPFKVVPSPPFSHYPYASPAYRVGPSPPVAYQPPYAPIISKQPVVTSRIRIALDGSQVVEQLSSGAASATAGTPTTTLAPNTSINEPPAVESAPFAPNSSRNGHGPVGAEEVPVLDQQQGVFAQEDEYGNLVQVDEFGHPVDLDQDGQPMPLLDPFGNQLFYDQNGVPFCYGADGIPMTYDDNNALYPYENLVGHMQQQ